ncbi:16S rRNA (cytidine(1402)-2'-O)-methyltransferase [Patescibacteria group bacterium]
MDCASAGKLYIVATPIGNLKDITLRALETLKSVDLILSEDTRETQKLLNHFEIEKPQTPYTDQKHDRTIDFVIEKLDLGKNIALVSDSGTPVISDPGFNLVRDLKAKGYCIESIPGPSSPIAALSISGLPTDKFTFIGFLPKSDGKKTTLLKHYANNDASLVIFESPNRINKTLKLINDVLGNRVVCVAKDLTKKFENVETHYIKKIIRKKVIEKGEYIIIIAKEGYKLNG